MMQSYSVIMKSRKEEEINFHFFASEEEPLKLERFYDFSSQIKQAVQRERRAAE